MQSFSSKNSKSNNNSEFPFDMEMIVACTQSGLIGNNGSMPWHIPEDLQRFKDITENGIVIMGRKTFDTLPGGKLKNRINIVITRSFFSIEMNNLDSDIIYANENTMNTILLAIREKTKKPVFVIGGAEIYKMFFQRCKYFYFTFILDNNITGDTFLDKAIVNIPFNKEYKKIQESSVMKSIKKNTEYAYVTYKKLE